MRAVVMGGVALALGLIGLARAADTIMVKPDDIIAARQAGFDLQGGVLAAMKATVDSGGAVKPLTDGAKGLSSWGHVIPSMFPDGTQTGRNTKAKAEIWSDRAGFEKAAANFYTAADKLVTFAEADDKAGFATQFKETGAACGACHRAYRERS
jgi:cytochrome c556